MDRIRLIVFVAVLGLALLLVPLLLWASAPPSGAYAADLPTEAKPAAPVRAESKAPGGPSLLATGGPDDFGYTYIDSDEPCGPTFNWEDISTTGISLTSVITDFMEPDTNGLDDVAWNVTIPFTFTFYGADYTQVAVSSDGYLNFDSGPADFDPVSYTNQCLIPDPAAPNNAIYGFWDDFNLNSGGEIYVETRGTAPNRRFIVQYHDVASFYSPAPPLWTVRFQVILFEGSNDILIQYDDVQDPDEPSWASGGYATEGLEGPAAMNTGLQYEDCDTSGNLHNGLAVLYSVSLVVNDTGDASDAAPGDGICDTAGTGITCTLRAAIEEANASAGTNTIHFNIPGPGPHTIQPGSALPVIIEPVIIDGYTEPDAAPATGATNADLMIVLDGSSAGNGVNGLVLETDDSKVCGLNIRGFRVTDAANNKFTQGNGIVVREGMTNTIAGNFIGTNVTGDACIGNGGSGVLIGGLDSTADAISNTVGGTDPADRNIITCNGFQRDTGTPDPDDGTATGADGVTIRANYEGGLGYLSVLTNTVVGNYIGTDVSGAMTLTTGTQTFVVTVGSLTFTRTITHTGNTGNGVRIAGGSGNTVGGTTDTSPGGDCTGACNLISGNELAGVRIEAVPFNDPPTLIRPANNNVVQGNYIGTDVNGTYALGNLDVGVYIVGLADDADDNQIGGTTAAARNVIAGNVGGGVMILGGEADNNTVQGNYVGTNDNGTAAIPNDAGGINITDAMTNTIGGTVAGARNLVSGNGGHGISIVNSPTRWDHELGIFVGTGEASGNTIQGNYIGTEVNGTAPLSNTLNGVVIVDAAGNTVGGMTPGERNLISGNGENGALIMNAYPPGNVETNVVTVEGASGSASDGAAVTITDQPGVLQVAKTVTPTVAEVGDVVTFTIQITNTSAADVMIKRLSDWPHGNLNGQGTCSVPQSLAGGGGWQENKATASDAQVGDFFGYAASISGDTLVVGAPYEAGGAGDPIVNAGAAYVFERNQGGVGNWGEVTKLTASDTQEDDRFGISVSISGDTLVVGASNEDGGAGDPIVNAGAVYVFERNQGGADNWGQVTILHASDAQAGDLFGNAVSISGDTLVVGALGEDTGGSAAGAVYVFERNQGGLDNWGEVIKLTASDAQVGDLFGNAASISGDTLVVGAPYEAGGAGDPIVNAGAAYVFERDYDPLNPGTPLADNWGEVTILHASDAQEDDRFGVSVSISGDTLVVGAQYEDGGAGDPLNDAGAAYVFERNQGGADNWGEVIKLTASDAQADDFFGYAASISGDTLVVGADEEDGGVGDPFSEAGAAYVFERYQGGLDNWGQVTKLTASDAQADDYFGWSVSISGDTLLVGAYGEDTGGSAAGAAYVFGDGPYYYCAFSGPVLGFGGNSETDTLTASGTDENGNFVIGSGSATVNISPTLSSIVVTKTANPTTLDPPGGTVNFTITVKNIGVSSVTINNMWDTKHGKLMPGGPCGGSVSLNSGDSYTCTFSASVSGATGNTVEGNYIGTDNTGTYTVPNQRAGVAIAAPDNAIEGNVISGNAQEGVILLGANATGNSLRYNLIGLRADAADELSNGSHGVLLIAGPSDNAIGSSTGVSNTIAYNGGDGVVAFAGTGNQILSNSIFDNTELGIDLGHDNAVTPNDDEDPDPGANDLQNYPVLTSASAAVNPVIQGVLNSTPGTQFTIQFFSSLGCDPSGFGEGRTYLGTDTTSTDESGNATINTPITGDLTDQYVTATATDPYSNTSEFSNCIPVPSAPALGINKEVQDLNGGDAESGDRLRYTIHYSNTGTAPATGVFITDTYSTYCITITNVTHGDFANHDDNDIRIRWPIAGGIVLHPQASGSVRYDCILPITFTVAGDYDVTNTATIDSGQTDPDCAGETPSEEDPTDGCDMEEVTVTAAPVLTIDKECTPATGNTPGDTVHCVIQYANTGDANATFATIVDDYDQSKVSAVLIITGSVHFAASINDGDTITWDGTVTIPAGESGQVEYDYTLEGIDVFPYGTTPVTNTATINSAEVGPVQDEETIQVLDTTAPVLTIDKQVQDLNGGLAEPNDVLRYTINYANTGTADAPGTFITDDYSDLCASIAIISNGDFSPPSDTAGVLRWPASGGITLAPGGGAVSFDCTLQDSFPAGTTRVTNTSTIDSDETDPEQDTATLATVTCFDFNNSGSVDVGDIMLVANRWNATVGDPNYDPMYDVDGDGCITVVDIMMVAAQWGQTCP